MAIEAKAKWFVCRESFAATLYDSAEDEAAGNRGTDIWFKAGQRAHADNPVFTGKSGKNRLSRFFVAEESA